MSEINKGRQKEINKYTILLFHVKYTTRKALVKYKKIKEKELLLQTELFTM